MSVFRIGSGRRGRLLGMAAVLGLMCSALPFLPLGASVDAAAPAYSPGRMDNGFPEWFQDVNGVRVAPCLDPNDTNCLAPLTGPGYDATLPLSFPTNFPDEFFYSAVDSEPISATDCSAAPTGTISAHLALEAAFANADVIPGDQMVFGRIRFRVGDDSGLCANSWYTFKTPYGDVTVQTDENGTLLGRVAAANTTDIGCFPTAVVPCDYAVTLTAPPLALGLLRQDPADPDLPAAPAAGYLGNGGFTRITGSSTGFHQLEVVKWPAGLEPANGGGYEVSCTDPGCLSLGGTDKFAVLAKLAGPIDAPVDTLDFGGVLAPQTTDTGTLPGSSATRSVDLTNLGAGATGQDAATIVSVAVVDPSGQFSLQGDTCAATVVARDAACAATVTFTPNTTGAQSAALEVVVDGSPTAFRLPLAGTGTAPGDAAHVLLDPIDQNLVIGDVRISNASAVHTVTVTNDGSAPLVATPTLTGPSQFTVTGDTCTGRFVAAGANCTIGVRFVPTARGPLTAQLQLATNTADGVLTVVVAANGTGGVAAVSPEIDPDNTFPTWYQDESGLRVGQCDEPLNPVCITAPIEAGPQVLPGNYPDEWFYYMAASEAVTIQDPLCQVEPGDIMVESAVEAAFFGPVVPGGGMTFGRQRIVIRGGLCPETEYLVTHPYGQTMVVTNDAGGVKPSPGTTDIGCIAEPCDFTLAIASPVFEGFLEQVGHPAGLLGDPLVPAKVTGAPFVDPRSGQPANFVLIERLDQAGEPDSVLGFSDLFGVTGRLAGPIVASPTSVDFGAAEAGLLPGPAAQDITFTNTGIADVTLAATPVTFEGTHAADASLVPATTTCLAGTQLAPGASCVVTVTLLPGGTGVRSATAVLHHDGRNSPTGVPLTAIGNAPAGSAALSTASTQVRFVDLHIGEASASAKVEISNIGGQAVLEVGAPAVTAATPFEITANTCSLVQPGETCSLSVRFVPTEAGAATAELTIPGRTFGTDPDLVPALPTITLPLSGKGTNVVPTQSASSTTAGFPSWFQDRNGLRLEQCMATDGNCVVLPGDSFDPTQPISFPTNYPDESFWFFADSDIITVPADASCGAAGGTVLLGLATEAAFTGAAPAAGTQTWFNRLRITADGLCANTTYQFVHPYGVTSLTTDGAGEIRPKDGTFDVDAVTGSLPTDPGYLRWDPNVAPFAPTGYIGHPGVLHTVVGSNFRYGTDPEPVNYAAVIGPSGEVGRTDKWAVAGRLAGPVVSNITSRDFGTIEVGHQTAVQTVIVSNIGGSPVQVAAPVVTGATTEFEVLNVLPVGSTQTLCSTLPLLQTDDSCVVLVRYSPTTAGSHAATLTIGHDALRGPVTVSLTGTAVPLQTPAMVGSATTLAFGNVIVGTNSTNQVLTVRNSGTGALQIGTLDLGGANPTRYSIVATTCRDAALTGVVLAPGVSCTVTVRYSPNLKASQPATLTVSATDAVTVDGHVPVAVSSLVVSLTGTGVQGTIALSTSSITMSARAGSTATSRLTLTNTGNANFSLQSLGATPALSFVAVSGVNPTSKFSATSSGCNNVVPGRSCQVTVSFTPGAGTVNEVFRVQLKILSNASNSQLLVNVQGTRTR
ncbi:MAG: choice-of-anchor D domain-containing protein [Ilumatobacteraceae bacterium]